MDSSRESIICDSCEKGYLLQADKLTCSTVKDCPVGPNGQFLLSPGVCEYCLNTDCIMCAPADSGQTCLCDTNYIWDSVSKACVFDNSLCALGCQICIGLNPTDCTKCLSNYYMKTGIGCVANCGSQFYADQNNLTCNSCDSFCDVCSGAATTDCSLCLPQYYKSDPTMTCASCVITNCVSCSYTGSNITCNQCDSSSPFLYVSTDGLSCVDTCVNANAGVFQDNDN